MSLNLTNWSKRILIAMIGLLAAVAGDAYAGEWTAGRAGSTVTVEIWGASSSTGTHYFRSGQGWGSAGCASAQWAYIHASDMFATEILAAVMQARQLNEPILFYGECDSGGAYFHIQSIWY